MRQGLESYFTNDFYEILRNVLHGRRLPLAFVDLDAFDANIVSIAEIVKDSDKSIRTGTKSIRCEPLMRRIQELGGHKFH